MLKQILRTINLAHYGSIN